MAIYLWPIAKRKMSYVCGVDRESLVAFLGGRRDYNLKAGRSGLQDFMAIKYLNQCAQLSHMYIICVILCCLGVGGLRKQKNSKKGVCGDGWVYL